MQELVTGRVAESVVDRAQPVHVLDGHGQPGPVEGRGVQSRLGDGAGG
jgi:hypothetical protein